MQLQYNKPQQQFNQLQYNHPPYQQQEGFRGGFCEGCNIYFGHGGTFGRGRGPVTYYNYGVLGHY